MVPWDYHKFYPKGFRKSFSLWKGVPQTFVLVIMVPWSEKGWETLIYWAYYLQDFRSVSYFILLSSHPQMSTNCRIFRCSLSLIWSWILKKKIDFNVNLQKPKTVSNWADNFTNVLLIQTKPPLSQFFQRPISKVLPIWKLLDNPPVHSLTKMQ